MLQQRRLFGTNGIRGIVNKELTPELVTKLGSAVGTFFRGGCIFVGYDGRVSSPMFSQAILSGLISTGCTVYNAGMISTPALQYGVKHHSMDGGVMITASHNPPEYNGIKVIGNDGIELPREQEIEIEEIFFEEKLEQVAWNKIGQTQMMLGILDEYMEAIKSHVDGDSIQKKRLRIVIDPGNGVGGLTAPQLFRELGCHVITINANVDGTFPGRPSEPRPENLGELASTVKAVGADVGVAYDGDADRSIFVDENGEIHPGDRTFALVEKYFLQEHPGETVVTPVSSSCLVKEIADECGSKVVWTKVGSVIVSHTMKKTKAKLGGEENGGVFYGPHQPVRDGAMTTALILEIMAKTGKKLSQLLAELPYYVIVKDKVPCPHELKTPVLEEFVCQLKGLKVDTVDGVKIWFADKSSILIRPSGTEPIYRLYAEAKTHERVAELIKEYKTKLCETISKFER